MNDQKNCNGEFAFGFGITFLVWVWLFLRLSPLKDLKGRRNHQFGGTHFSDTSLMFCLVAWGLAILRQPRIGGLDQSGLELEPLASKLLTHHQLEVQPASESTNYLFILCCGFAG